MFFELATYTRKYLKEFAKIATFMIDLLKGKFE
jgi:hypothetical protein